MTKFLIKKILIILVLLFSSSVLAEDISDFQIEGMSVGDSLLDYFSEEKIRNNISDVYDYIEDKTFVMAAFLRSVENETLNSFATRARVGKMSLFFST